MHIGYDADEVLFLYIDALIQWHNPRFGTQWKRSDFQKYNIQDNFHFTLKEEQERIDLFEQSLTFRNLQLVPGAFEAIYALAQDHHKQSIITGRNDCLTDITQSSVNTYFPGIFSGIHFTNHYTDNGKKKTKSSVCTVQNIDLLVEDNPDHALDCAAYGIPVLLLDQPWNQNLNLPTNVRRVYSWSEIVKYVQQEIA